MSDEGVLVSDVAKALGVNPTTVYYQIEQGRLWPVPNSRPMRVQLQTIFDFVVESPTLLGMSERAGVLYQQAVWLITRSGELSEEERQRMGVSVDGWRIKLDLEIWRAYVERSVRERIESL
jgi:hypothetical protein